MKKFDYVNNYCNETHTKQKKAIGQRHFKI